MRWSQDRCPGFNESQRDSVLQPRVGVFQPTLGNGRTKRSNPDGVASATVKQYSKTDTTLCRVANLIFFSPGLAETRQPWAGGRNPFGIHTATEFCMMPPGELTT